MTEAQIHATILHALRLMGQLGLDNDRRLQMDLRCFHAELLAQPRHADRKRLVSYGNKIYSQNDIDPIEGSGAIRASSPRGRATCCEGPAADLS